MLALALADVDVGWSSTFEIDSGIEEILEVEVELVEAVILPLLIATCELPSTDEAEAGCLLEGTFE